MAVQHEPLENRAFRRRHLYGVLYALCPDLVGIDIGKYLLETFHLRLKRHIENRKGLPVPALHLVRAVGKLFHQARITAHIADAQECNHSLAETVAKQAFLKIFQPAGRLILHKFHIDVDVNPLFPQCQHGRIDFLPVPAGIADKDIVLIGLPAVAHLRMIMLF